MPPFQAATDVRVFQTTGIPGEIAREGPMRSLPWTLISPNTATRPNTIGNAFTAIPGGGNERTALPGGAGVFAGILGRPKEYALLGTSLGTLEASFDLPNNRPGTLFTMGILYATLSTGGALGDNVFYESTVGTGALASVPGTVLADHTQILGATVVVQTETTPGLVIIQLTI